MSTPTTTPLIRELSIDEDPAPDAATPKADGEDEEEEEELNGEDKGVDYRLLFGGGGKDRKTGSSIVIPKRGEKDFEPLELGVNVQERALRDGREAMFGALRGLRGGASRNMSHAYLPAPTAQDPSPLPCVLISRGNQFATLGHTIRAPALSLPPPPVATALPFEKPKPGSSSEKPISGPARESRIVLLPEEALYLLERGSLTIWHGGSMSADAGERAKECDLAKAGGENAPLVEEVFAHNAVRMTVQEGWSLWGKDVDRGRYSVYAHLKRLGYVVHRAPKHLPAVVLASVPRSKPPQPPTTLTPFSLGFCVSRVGLGVIAVGHGIRRGVSGLWDALVIAVRGLGRLLLAGPRSLLAMCSNFRTSDIDLEDAVWEPLVSRRAKLASNYTHLFSSLRIIPSPASSNSTSSPSRRPSVAKGLTPDPYDVYFHVWRPTSSYKKSSPTPPDYEISVVAAADSAFPSQASLLALFDATAQLGPPAPRYPPRVPRPSKNGPSSPVELTSTKSQSWLDRVLVELGLLPPLCKEKEVEVKPKGAAGNPFPFLKQGDRSVILAVVEGGAISWNRFGRGVFGSNQVQ